MAEGSPLALSKLRDKSDVARKSPEAEPHRSVLSMWTSTALRGLGNRLITVNDGGVFSALDRGVTWRPHNASLPLVQFYGGAVHPTRNNLILGNT